MMLSKLIYLPAGNFAFFWMPLSFSLFPQNTLYPSLAALDEGNFFLLVALAFRLFPEMPLWSTPDKMREDKFNRIIAQIANTIEQKG